MPYIVRKRREVLDPTICPEHAAAECAGELNFQITRLVDRFISDKGLCYETLNAAMGVLECAKAEVYRRVVTPLEDCKEVVNGDVYDCIAGKWGKKFLGDLDRGGDWVK